MKRILAVLSLAVAIGCVLTAGAGAGIDGEMGPDIADEPIMGCPEHRPNC